MEISARISGFNYWSLLIPQALAGVTTVGVLYTTVRRWFGPRAAIIAGAVMALAPVATLMFRFDDALMTLMITLAGYAMTRAAESGRTRWMVLTGVFLGAGFLSKMLAAFMVLPSLALVYLWAGPPKLGKRIWQLLVGGVAVAVTSGWWVLIVLLTPAADRPFIGSSTDNNILNLIFVYNGFGRLTGNERGGGAGPAAGGAADTAGRAAGAADRTFGGGAFGGSGGITRLFSAEYGGQVAWLIPAALIAIDGFSGLGDRTGDGRTDGRAAWAVRPRGRRNHQPERRHGQPARDRRIRLQVGRGRRRLGRGGLAGTGHRRCPGPGDRRLQRDRPGAHLGRVRAAGHLAPGPLLRGQRDRWRRGRRVRPPRRHFRDASQVTAWVEAHFTAKTVGGETVYDLTAPKSAS